MYKIYELINRATSALLGAVSVDTQERRIFVQMHITTK